MTTTMNRRKFFAQLKKHGFSKSDLQMTRVGLTYEKLDENGRTIRITVPKSHSETFAILGPVDYSGIWVNGDLRKPNWGKVVKPTDFGMENMLEVCIALISGDLRPAGAEEHGAGSWSRGRPDWDV